STSTWKASNRSTSSRPATTRHSAVRQRDTGLKCELYSCDSVREESASSARECCRKTRLLSCIADTQTRGTPPRVLGAVGKCTRSESCQTPAPRRKSCMQGQDPLDLAIVRSQARLRASLS